MHAPCRIAGGGRAGVVLWIVALLAPAMSLAGSAGDSASIGGPHERMPPSLSPGAFEGRTVRVTLGSRTLVGASPRLTPEGITLPASAPGGSGYSAPALLPWKDVERIDVRENSTRTGAILGGVTAGLLAAALVAAVASDPFLGGNADPGGMIAFTAAGAAGGAVVGALLGSAIPRWRTVYRRDAPAEARIGGSAPSRGSRP